MKKRVQISRTLFEEQRRPRFGTTNPEQMQLEFWEWMIRGENSPMVAEEGVLAKAGLIVRGGIIKSAYGPYRARDLFKVPLDRKDGPIWTFDRMGATRTELPDGRVVCVGGEHEDSYDPDFCIYNDVVVFEPEDRIEIYGYPREVFPPTDFHTATLVGDRLILIGCWGYPDDYRPGHTPVYALDLSGYRISRIHATGEPPGWLYEHEAEADAQEVITIRGGRLIEAKGGKPQYRPNYEDYTLDLRSGVWRRLTNRNWPQFAIRQADGGRFVPGGYPEPATLLPDGIDLTIEPCQDPYALAEMHRGRFRVQGVLVSVNIDSAHLESVVEVVVEGGLPEDLTWRIAEGVRAKTEAVIHRPCLLERVSAGPPNK